MCSTKLNETINGDLNISCLLHCLEVGTVGGGSILPAQQANLGVFLKVIYKFFLDVWM